MTFTRLWTALLAGACAAVPATLCYATAGSFLLAPLGRDALTSAFLVIWAALSLCCVVPSRMRNQWLVGIWNGAVLVGTLFLLILAETLAPAPLIICGGLCGVLVLLGTALTGLRFGR